MCEVTGRERPPDPMWRVVAYVPGDEIVFWLRANTLEYAEKRALRLCQFGYPMKLSVERTKGEQENE